MNKIARAYAGGTITAEAWNELADATEQSNSRLHRANLLYWFSLVLSVYQIGSTFWPWKALV